ncbi:patatin [Oleiphilus sp. HI0071]|nr:MULTISPECIES: patatin-like phospholipase family protein [unclassified Oleiphilus]KZY61082.1 patatin [Oleiphilus sp. HI0065]KZY89704.1 patatin [Oleiphilus sp. HI0073]KZY90256.1 patatin [Oleiphilus sp. HI0071]KZZ46462.1 patatin [Oleiphilus sp. HI0118]KZZ55859.1 patatin [Oleiphilus sp. HI0122]KZZ67987.1 patatin [Oleiphilus sp. HI0130]KZZ80559.1 patatin [Oleiphilus sp. HI0133]
MRFQNLNSFNPFNTRIGLALGGGAAKGVAHIGALKALQEEGIDVDCISGTSIGAFVASYYAFGKSIDEMREVALNLTFKSMASFSWKASGGLFSTDAVREMLIRDLGDAQIEDAQIPLSIAATDICTGEQVVFNSGSVADAVCASVAVPGLFAPVEVQGRKLVDGGIIENVPVSLLKPMDAGIIIAINLSGNRRYATPKSTADSFSNAIDICIDHKTNEQLKQADIILNLDLTDYSRADNRPHTDELINEGYKAMMDKAKSAKQLKRVSLIRYIIRLAREVIPLKIPHIISRFYEAKNKLINIGQKNS